MQFNGFPGKAVDVPPAEFIAAEAGFRPCLVAASFLVTESFGHFRELVEMFDDAFSGVAICQRLASELKEESK